MSKTNPAIADCVGRDSYINFFNVVVVSRSTDIIEVLVEALSEMHSRDEHLWKLGVLHASSLEDIIRHVDANTQVGMDFVVLALDTSSLNCLEWAKKILEHVDPDLRANRVILVNASGLPPNAMAVGAGELLSFSSEMNLEIIHVNLLNVNEAKFLARRLLKHMEVTFGLTGLPNLNI